MLPAPPIVNLLVIRSVDIERAVSFYRELGMPFVRHSHDGGPEHYSSTLNGFVFEIYPQRGSHHHTTSSRFGFKVADVDSLVESLQQIGATIVQPPENSAWGRRAVVKDFDGHTVELLGSYE